MQVLCTNCMWHGDKKEIVTNFPDDLDRCPKCIRTGFLVDLPEKSEVTNNEPR